MAATLFHTAATPPRPIARGVPMYAALSSSYRSSSAGKLVSTPALFLSYSSRFRNKSKQRLHAGAGASNAFSVHAGSWWVVGWKHTGHVISVRGVGVGRTGDVEFRATCVDVAALYGGRVGDDDEGRRWGSRWAGGIRHREKVRKTYECTMCICIHAMRRLLELRHVWSGVSRRAGSELACLGDKWYLKRCQLCNLHSSFTQ